MIDWFGRKALAELRRVSQRRDELDDRCLYLIQEKDDALLKVAAMQRHRKGTEKLARDAAMNIANIYARSFPSVKERDAAVSEIIHNAIRLCLSGTLTTPERTP